MKEGKYAIEKGKPSIQLRLYIPIKQRKDRSDTDRTIFGKVGAGNGRYDQFMRQMAEFNFNIP
jgi:hypothetical protein